MNLSDVKPSDDELRVMLEAGFVLRDAAHFDDAETVFRSAMQLLPGADVPHVALGTVALQRGDYAEAERICREAVEHHPDSLYAKVNYAEAMLFLRRRDEALKMLHAIIEQDSASPHARTARALIDAANLISAS